MPATNTPPNPTTLKLEIEENKEGDLFLGEYSLKGINTSSITVEQNPKNPDAITFNISFNIEGATIEPANKDYVAPADLDQLKNNRITYLELKNTEQPNFFEMDIKQLPTLSKSEDGMNLLFTTISYYLGDDGTAGNPGKPGKLPGSAGGNGKLPGSAGSTFDN